MSQQKVAILTAAGSGMGAAAARKLAADGFQVAILSSSGKGEALAKELGGLGMTGSNLSPDDIARLVEATMQRWGRIDAVVNSAGHGPKGKLLEISDADWTRGMEFYLLNVVRITRLVTPIMQAQRSGSIVNISTYATFEPEAAFPTSGYSVPAWPPSPSYLPMSTRRPTCV
ncbi:short chain dehydrogenase family protein [Bordetella holmesii ATCC 51541]|nr:short chain dehydrogenase family protein [Bordetella holmesii ATCC 51541]EWM48092.1 short chain dehydrogenase family protein [Bordetella holmesii 35009]